jgi:hypothetical protein
MVLQYFLPQTVPSRRDEFHWRLAAYLYVAGINLAFSNFDFLLRERHFDAAAFNRALLLSRVLRRDARCRFGSNTLLFPSSTVCPRKRDFLLPRSDLSIRRFPVLFVR